MTEPISKKPTWHVKPAARSRARALRTKSTNAERIIWRAVRAHRLNGVGFRRQTPIGPYIVDFVSHTAKLIVELDGGQHFHPTRQMRDARRDDFLRSKGFRVLRFSNYDVMTNIEGVWNVIAAACETALAPSLPSPASGGGKVDCGDLPLNAGGANPPASGGGERTRPENERHHSGAEPPSLTLPHKRGGNRSGSQSPDRGQKSPSSTRAAS